MSRYLTKLELKNLKLKYIVRNCKISNLVSFVGKKNISILDGTRIDDFTVLVAHKGYINIGKNTHIGGLSYIQGWKGVEIGSECNISQGVKIYSKSDNYTKKKNIQILKKVIISNRVIIGSNAVILPGSKIEDDSRIGALSVVSHKITKQHLFARNRIVKIY